MASIIRRRRGRRLLGVACALAALAGCRSDPYTQVYTEKLTSEIRVLEDQLYACGYENKVLQQKLHRLRAERSELEPDAADVEPEVEPDAEPDVEPDVILGEPSPPDIELGIPDDPDLLVPPEVDEGELLERPESDPGDQPEGQIRLPESVNILFDHEPGPPHAIKIDPVRSRGRDFDGTPGDDGVHLLLAIVDEAGMPLSPDREIEIAILDPTGEGAEARLGTWAFTAAELSRLARGDADGRISLPIHWQEAVPRGDSVVVFARMALPDGGQFTTDRVIQLRRRGAELWTPRGS